MQRANRLFVTLAFSPLLLSHANNSFAQDTTAGIPFNGSWQVSGSDLEETLTFDANGEFLVAHTFRKKDGKDTPPTTRIREGAYLYRAGACSAGDEKGNLWMVKEAERCCFKAYMLGKTLVLDQVGGSSLGLGLCTSKTMKRSK